MFDRLGRWLRRQQGIERNPIYRLATDVIEGRISAERAYQLVENTSVLNRLADGDLWDLDREAARAAADDPRHAIIIVRLAILAARYKGFDRVLVDCNLRAAELLAELGDTHEQELHLREALHAAQRIANIPGQRRVLARLARLAFDRGDADRAQDLLSRQLETGREDSDTLEDVETALLLGDLARSRDDIGSAREFYHRAGRSARRVGHFAGVVDALLRQVVILRELGDTEAAFLLLQQAQDAAERTIDSRLQAEIAIQSAAILAEHQQYDQASAQLMTALERSRAAGDLAMESRCLNGLTRVERRSGQLLEAAGHYEELANLEERLGNRAAAVRALLDAVELLLDLDQSSTALTALQRALPITENLNEPGLRQRALGLCGLAYSAVGQPSEAMESLVAAIRASRESQDVLEEARWLLGLGEALLRSGEFNDAFASTRRALEIIKEHGDQRQQAQALALLGLIELGRGQHREADDYLQRALASARSVEDAAEELGYLQILARVAREGGQAESAIRYLRQALDIAVIHAGPETQVRLHGQIAQLYRATNHLDDAEKHYQAAVTAADEAGNPHLAARALRSLATLQDKADNYQAAAENYRRAIDLAEQLDDRRVAVGLHYNVGALLLDHDQQGEALHHLSRALELAMQEGNYQAAEAARELLAWITPPPANSQLGSRGSEDLLLDEIAVSGEPNRLREIFRD